MRPPLPLVPVGSDLFAEGHTKTSCNALKFIERVEFHDEAASLAPPPGLNADLSTELAAQSPLQVEDVWELVGALSFALA